MTDGSIDDESILLLEEYCEERHPTVHPIFDLIREYRNLDKIISTYIEGILKYCDLKISKVHCDFYQLGADSGRLIQTFKI